MAAKISAKGVMKMSVLKFNAIIGKLNVGNPALIPSPPSETINDLTV